jgi:hypothetical protein
MAELTPLTIAKMVVHDAVRALARDVADANLSADNIDRPISETPWLAPHRYGSGEYDARWYSVQGVVDGIHEGVATNERLSAALDVLAAVAVVSAGDG